MAGLCLARYLEKPHTLKGCNAACLHSKMGLTIALHKQFSSNCTFFTWRLGTILKAWLLVWPLSVTREEIELKVTEAIRGFISASRRDGLQVCLGVEAWGMSLGGCLSFPSLPRVLCWVSMVEPGSTRLFSRHLSKPSRESCPPGKEARRTGTGPAWAGEIGPP